MALLNALLFAFNRGLVSLLALARVDIKRLALSAEIFVNWMPRNLGSMLLRPGLKYLDSTFNNSAAINIPFIFSIADTAIIELTDQLMRVRVSEAVITRVAVSTAITNGGFTTDLTGWTDNDDAGATSAWATGNYLSLIGTKYNAAKRYQTVTVAGGDANKEHALHIIVFRGKPSIRVGSTVSGEEYIADTVIGPGVHSLAFTPTGNFTIEFSNRTEYAALIDSVAIEAAGDMTLVTPWLAADLAKIRWAQSADVEFIATYGYQQRRIERHAVRSWSVVKYLPEDGPFRIVNTSTTRLTASATFGDITLTADRSIFKTTHVGALYRLSSFGQREDATVAGAAQFSDPIRINGVGSSRQFSITVTGTWVGTLTLQRSVGEVGSWTAVETYTTNQSKTYNDTLDNQIIFYRLGFDTGNYTSGTATILLEYSSGGKTGVVLLTAVSTGLSASAAVLSDLGGITATQDWAESVWSDKQGWPSAVVFAEGRLWWPGKNWNIGSVSDAFESFDDTIEGDSAPIIRSIGDGPVDTINWALSLQRLILGGQSAEISARSSNFDEPLTPTNYNIKNASTQGSSNVAAVRADDIGIYVSTNGWQLYALEFDANKYDYGSENLTELYPNIGSPGFTRIVVQRKPDTRIHAMRSDGTVMIMVFNPLEKVRCMVNFTTDGLVEDMFVLPGAVGDEEDKVYYLIKRTINGSTKRYLEKWALESECVGGTLNKQADSFISGTQAASSTITGLSSIEAKSVVVWANGVCLADTNGDILTFTVSSGQITGLTHYGVAILVTSYAVGIAYVGQFKSTKLAYAAQLGTALGMQKRVTRIGLVAANTHHKGIQFGPSFDRMDTIPQNILGANVAQDTVYPTFDVGDLTFPGGINNDIRLCLQASAPRPANLMAAVLGIATDDGSP